MRKDDAGRGVPEFSPHGFAVLSVTTRHPGIFGRCRAESTGAADSGGFKTLFQDLARLPAGSVRVHLDAGTLEASIHGFDLLALTRRLRATLSRWQSDQSREVPEDHSWISWRPRLAEAWTFFQGRTSAPRGRPRLERRGLPASPSPTT